MSKEVKSFSLDEDIAEMLDNDANLNNSSVVNSLLREYLVSGQSTDVALKMRLKDLERELENKKSERQRLDSQIDRLNREIEDVRDQIRERRKEGIKEVRKFAEDLYEDIGSENVTPENPAVKNHAQKAQMSPERFIKEVQKELEQ